MFRTNKQLTFSVIAFTFLLFAIYSYFIINYKILFMNDDYPAWMDVQTRISTHNESNFNFVVMGDSRAKAAFMPNEFDDEEFNSINLALPGSTPITGYFTLKKYLENNNAPETLLLGYSAYLLSGPYFYTSNTVKFRYLESEDYDEIVANAQELDDDELISSVDHREYAYSTGKYLTDLFMGIKQARWGFNLASEKSLLKSKGHNYPMAFIDPEEESSELTLGTFESSKIVHFYLERMLALANEHDIDVYWYTYPIPSISYDNVPEQFLTSYQSYIDNLSQKYSFTVLSELYGLDSSHFGDPDHLYSGSAMVTGMIKTDILKAKAAK